LDNDEYYSLNDSRASLKSEMNLLNATMNTVNITFIRLNTGIPYFIEQSIRTTETSDSL